jgi:hypothetical protein
MISILAMPTKIGQQKYLVLAHEDFTSQVEGCARRKKTSVVVCQFLLEYVLYKYGCVGQVIRDRGELDTSKARVFFTKLRVRLTLTMTYNLEPNGKIKWGHSLIIKMLIVAYNTKVKISCKCFHMHYGLI